MLARICLFIVMFSVPVSAQVGPVFTEVVSQGFGDRQNSGVWSMKWWNGRLYVGTVRSWLCWSMAVAQVEFPFLPYPPTDPDTDCAPDPLDLALQAEVWRWTPEGDLWELVYQSPADVPVEGQPGKFTARDVGFRGMGIFQEPDQTEALYVVGVSPDNLNPNVGPPRILRSSDGETFAPLAQDPGTFLGDLTNPSYRGLVNYNDHLYILAGGLNGSGVLIGAQDPAGGNDQFQQFSSSTVEFFEMAVFNDYLYVGTNDKKTVATGFEVWRTDAQEVDENGHYIFTPVLPAGAYGQPAARSAVSMHVFNNALYVGTNTPVELIRIHPDDSWDLVVGTARDTPDGLKQPLSGYPAGFGWPLNMHLWRIQEHAGVLYLGTADRGILSRNSFLPAFEDYFSGIHFGFDLFFSSDGVTFFPETRNGLNDPFQMGIRAFESTPEGLFMGTVDLWYGLKLFRGPDPPVPARQPGRLE